MKRFISIFLVIVITLSMPIMATASDLTGTIVNVGSFSIEFEATSSFTIEEQQWFAQQIADHSISSDNATTYNLWCNMFGHKLTTETITVIEHCVSDTQPRCIKSIQELSACSRCDYTSIEVLNSIYIYCCD